jgi:hypothetical protein
MAISSASIHFDRNADIRLEYVEAVTGAFRINEIVDGYAVHTASVFLNEDKAEALKAAIKAFNKAFNDALKEPIQEAA